MPTALITGASRGLGRTFADRLAAQGYDLVLVARDAQALHQAAAELREAHSRHVEVLPADLTDSEDRHRVEERLRTGGPVEMLVNNAGTWSYLPFPHQGIDQESDLLALNVTAVLRLTHAVLPRMIEAGGGRVLNIASMAGLAPVWTPSTYPASKAWVVSFSESLGRSRRLRAAGVHVTVVVPGYTRTQDHLPPEVADVPAWMWLDPETVVDHALRDARAGRTRSVPGRQYTLVAWALKHLPLAWTARLGLELKPVPVPATAPSAAPPAPAVTPAPPAVPGHPREDARA